MKSLTTTLLILGSLLCTSPAFADDSDFVRLKSASSFFWSGAGQAGRAINVQVRVKNVGYSKHVYLHYNAGSSGWTDLELSYTSHHGNYDLFSYNTSFSSWTGEIEFAIRYEVNGQTYWNNNDGGNFHLGSDDDFIIEDAVALSRMDADGYHCAGWMGCSHATHLSGEIYVQNLYYDKSVGVRCSPDGVNWEDIPAAYVSSTSGDVERWSFEHWDYVYQPGPEYPVYACAVFFDGFWDNNFSQDYQIQNEAIDQLR
jgi:hypothetical protein